MLKILSFIRRNAISLTALFVALGGTSYAAVSLPAGSVGTPQLRNGAVTSAKLANRAVTPGKLDPRGLGGSIRHWAQISQSGQVLGGSRGARASLTGVNDFAVTWGTEFSRGCAALLSPASLPGQATATTFAVFIGDLGRRGGKTSVVVFTYNGGQATPAAFSVAVVC